MQNEIIINANAGETRVAILEKSQFAELHIERASARSVVSNVVKGRVTRVLPGMQAAFVDIGLEKAAFLYVGDYLTDPAAGDGDEPSRRRRSRNGNGRTPPKIETLLREGEEIVVQVAKEPIGTKGARITSHLSVAGRHLVLTPSGARVGVSRRIDSDRERRRLREIVERLRPRGLGFIIRTAGEGIREAELEADIRYLSSVWDEIQREKDRVRAPERLYEEPALPLRMIRDFASSETRRIVVDSRVVFDQMKSFVDRFMTDPKPRLEHFQGPEPIFDHFGIEEQIDRSVGRKVWLKSGGHLIIDQSEALTAVDVNTGRYVGKRDLEETVLKTNLEAVKEVLYQLRLRNIGGLIIIDLIDMESLENREKVYRTLQETVRGDKARTNILKISELGLVEMTRKRTRENLVQTLCEPCAHCDGRGYLLSGESVAYKVLREIRKDLPRFCGRRVALSVNRRVAEHLLGPERETLRDLEGELGRQIEIRARADLHQEQFELVALDDGPAVDLRVDWLSAGTEAKQEEPEAGVEATLATAAALPPQTPEEVPAPAEAGNEPELSEPELAPETEPFDPAPSEGDATPVSSEPEVQPLDDEEEYRILPASPRPEES
ncbi:MAG: Rne/Rng family ribonuclease [Myxococcota bacterium]